MKLFHISDLHIGKRVNGFSMLEDQSYILDQIVNLAGEQRPDAVLIAGDLYDRSMPSAEAVELADDFLYRFTKLQIPVFLISGNHDCAERIAYGGRMMEQAGIYVSRVFDGEMQRYSMNGVDIWMLPYIRPAQVRRFYPEEVMETTQQAIEVILKHTEIKKDRVNILVMHQFFSGAAVCESEELSVGGSDQVDVSIMEDFDYVALGHLHGPQKVGRDTVRYSGSPLKYSFSEAGHQKSVTVVELLDKEEKGQIRISQLPLIPRLDLREIRGPIEELLRPEVYEAANPQDYLHITLTDREEVLDAMGRLRDVYPNVMRLDFETGEYILGAKKQELVLEEKSAMELFEEFFVLQNGYEMNEEQSLLVQEIWNEMPEKGGNPI